MRPRPTLLTKTCPYCGGRSHAEAKLPVPANIPGMEFNLDNLAVLVEKQSLSLLLALVELLPYKTFVCRKCHGEFRMHSGSTKEMVHAMLSSMRPITQQTAKPKRAAVPRPRPGIPPAHAPHVHAHAKPKPEPEPAADKKEQKDEWEAESLDALFDYSVDSNRK